MSFLNSLMGNKAVLKLALSTIKNLMDEKGITAIVILPGDPNDEETPGLTLKTYQEPIGVLTGKELADFAATVIDVHNESLEGPEKEVGNGL